MIPSNERIREGAVRRGGAFGSYRTLVLLAGLLALVLSCRAHPSSTQTAAGDVSLRLDAVPLLLKADSTATAVIWATVLDSGHPIADSTVVAFVASQGTITAQGYTKDGLAQASFTAKGADGVVSIVGQVKAVRDTVQLTVY